MLGGLSPTLFGLGVPAPGDALADEWWRVEEDGRVVGYGRLDDTWGDAEVLVLVDPQWRGTGLGAFILERLEHEAASRRLTTSATSCRAATPSPKRSPAGSRAAGSHRTTSGSSASRSAHSTDLTFYIPLPLR